MNLQDLLACNVDVLSERESPHPSPELTQWETEWGSGGRMYTRLADRMYMRKTLGRKSQVHAK